MTNLQWHDMQFALLRLPRTLAEVMKLPVWAGKVFVGGGYLRSIVSGEPVNDIDVFTTDKETAKDLACLLLGTSWNRGKGRIPIEELEEINARIQGAIHETGNALTFKLDGKIVQIIHRWTFTKAEDIINSFDFTVCCAVIWCDPVGTWASACHDKFYPDLAAKRLTYLAPKREEEAGGSMLRVLKYYQKGYRIPLDSLGRVMARMAVKVGGQARCCEQATAEVLTGLLREVDPLLDPTHAAHLPSEGEAPEKTVDIAGEIE